MSKLAANGGNAVNELSLPDLYAELSSTGDLFPAAPFRHAYPRSWCPGRRVQGSVRGWAHSERWGCIMAPTVERVSESSFRRDSPLVYSCDSLAKKGLAAATQNVL